ncbi:MAG: polyprenyl diphosphate synthase [Planctomycetota bacterium]
MIEPPADEGSSGEQHARPLTPESIAVIMDGNGRWAESRGLPRARGHEEGAETLRRLTRHCVARGVRELTCYALSTENFRRRPPAEVADLMRLLQLYLDRNREELLELGVRVRFIGHREELPPEVRESMERVERESAAHDGLVLRLAINYGSRSELVEAARALARAVRSGELAPEEIDEERLAAHLHDPTMADPDLLIRTAGEERLSNFLLWQASYSELHFAPCLWPDFTPERLEEAIASYAARLRKYGAVRSSDPVPRPPVVDAEGR